MHREVEVVDRHAPGYRQKHKVMADPFIRRRLDFVAIATHGSTQRCSVQRLVAQDRATQQTYLSAYTSSVAQCLVVTPCCIERHPPFATHLAQVLLFVTVGTALDQHTFAILRYLDELPVCAVSKTGRGSALPSLLNELPARLFCFSAGHRTLRGYRLEAVPLSAIQGRACVIRQPQSGEFACP